MDRKQWKLDQLALRAAMREHRASAVDGAPIARGSRRAAPLVSVIVVCLNAEDVLARCIDHLFAQDYPNYEIIVVDDASDDDTVGVARQAAQRGELTLLLSRRNRGCPSARNLGLSRAGGEIVAFVDADGFAAPDWLSGVVEAFSDDATIGAIASTVFFDENPLVLNGAGGTVNRQGWAADLSMNEPYGVAAVASQTLYPMGCGMALRREVVERVGPFDEQMLNYYDDVDYGIRIWRAGYRVVVAPNAWVDHRAGGGDSAMKRLLCERHRMRVVLKHTDWPPLREWFVRELESLRRASSRVRLRKLRAAAWNLRRMPSLLSYRRPQRGSPRVPQGLVDSSWGDGFPAGVTPRPLPRPESAREAVDMADVASASQLTHGWFAAERVNGRTRRWATPHAAALVHLTRTARRLRIDYSHVPVDIGGVDLTIRRVGDTEPGSSLWRTHLAWQYTAWSVENHPLELHAGDYEVVFEARRGWSDPPQDTRSLAFALASLRFTDLREIHRDGLDMASLAAEDQLLGGWFEPEFSDGHDYRWAGREGGALIRLDERCERARIVYRTPPGPGGDLTVAVMPLDQVEPIWTGRLAPAQEDWREAQLDLRLEPGDYVLSLSAERTWSNPEGRDPSLWGENRTLGFALSAIELSPSSATR
jgi:GT2 family glycosyltransferase